MASDFVQRGRQLLERGQFQEAVKVCRLGLLASPSELEGRLVLGSALTALRRYDEVLAEMRVALEIDGTSAWGLALKGEALLRKGDAAQSCDVLTRAMAAAPADQRIRDLYGEARTLRSQGMTAPRPTAEGRPGQAYGFGSTKTRDLSGGRDASTHLGTLPGGVATGVGTGPALTRPGGDRPGSNDLDPATEVVDFASAASSIGDVSMGIELDTGDLIAVDSPLSASGPLPGRRDEGLPLEYEATRRRDQELHDHLDGRAPRGGERRADLAESASRSRAVASARSGGPSRSQAQARQGEPGPPMDQLFPDDEDGVSKLELLDPRTGLPRQGGALAPDDRGAARSAEREPMRRLSKGSPSFGAEPGRGGPMRSPTEDMRMIRTGLGLPEEATSPGRSLPPEVLERERAQARLADPRVSGAHAIAQPGVRRPIETSPPGSAPRGKDIAPAPAARSASRSRRGIPLLVYAVLALVVVGGAVFAGFEVRGMRLDRQIQGARVAALELAATDTYTGYLRARDGFARIVKVRDDAATRAAYARIAARLFAEFGDGEADAIAAAQAIDGVDGADALAARAYVALGRGDIEVAAAATAALGGSFPDDPDADYLLGRAALAANRPHDAAEALRRALGRATRPLIYVHLARAEASQGRAPDAFAALDRARNEAPRHPSVVIWSALILARAELVSTTPGDPEASLEELIADGNRPAAEQVIGVAPAELAWAELALAEVALARGDRERARAALGRAAKRRPAELSFSAALADALMRAGDTVAARAEAARLIQGNPGRIEARILSARISLAAGDGTGALAALDGAGDLASRPDALVIRGRAELVAGALDKAAADLDAALALRPDLIEAVVARAEVDLAGDEARVALKRLEPLYQAGAPGALDLAVTYAEAVRRSGDLPRARSILDALAGSSPSYALSLERGRIARAEGAYGDAKRFFEKAREQNPSGIGARMELASLALETGDAATQRTLLDGLVLDAPESGLVLVEAAMAHTLTGDLEGAQRLLDRATALSPSRAWKLHRERGRLALRKLDAGAAAGELALARSLQAADAETHLLLLEASVVANDRPAARRALEDAAKTFRGTPLVALARGITALLEERSGEAVEEFVRAHTLLIAAKASPREIGRAAFWLGRAFYLEGNLARASEWLGRATEADASQADAYFFLGQVASESGTPARMAAAYEKSVAIDPAGNPLAWYFLAEHYAKARAGNRARAACDAYLARWPEGDFAGDLRALRSRLR